MEKIDTGLGKLHIEGSVIEGSIKHDADLFDIRGGNEVLPCGHGGIAVCLVEKIGVVVGIT